MTSTPSAINGAFAKALRQTRKAYGLTQEDFSTTSGRTYVSSLERGLKSPTLEKIADLAETLKVHPLTLLALTFEQLHRGETSEQQWKRIQKELKRITSGKEK